MENSKKETENKKQEERNQARKYIGKAESRRFCVVESRVIDRITYQNAKVPCGKKRCTTCPHGPYWYARVWHGDKRTRVYIGKEFMTLNEFNLKKRIEKLEKEKKEWKERS